MEKNEKAKGIFRLLFLAELISLVGSILQQANALSDSLVTVALIGALAALAGGIMQLVGLIKGRDVNKYFKLGLILIVFTVLAGIVSAILESFNGSSPIAGYVSKLEAILDILVSLCIIAAVTDIAKAEGNKDLHSFARKLGIVFIVLSCVGNASDFASAATASTLALVLAAIYVVVIVVAYVLFLRILGRAAKEL